MKWGGQRAKVWKAAVFQRYGRVCWLNYPGICTVVATTADHVIPRAVRPDLELEVTNGRPACKPCNQKRGKKAAPIRPRTDNRTWFERSHA